MLSIASSIRNVAIAGVGLGLCLLASACNQVNNPFKDSAEYTRAEMTTASSTEYLSKPAGTRPLVRKWGGAEVYAENGTVTHWPLWFEDPFEDKGNDVTKDGDRNPIDNRFAWNAADYLHILYGPSRFMLNMFGLPFSAVAQHPGRVMAADGRLDKGLFFYDHDARYGRPGDEPPDYNDLSRAGKLYRVHAPSEGPQATPAGEPAQTSPSGANAPASTGGTLEMSPGR